MKVSQKSIAWPVTATLVAGVAALAAFVSLHLQGSVGQAPIAIIRKAAGIDASAEGLQGFVNTCDALITPCLVAAAAATPLATIGGGIAMAFGARRGLQIVITSLGILALLGSVKGIVG
jgi:hypothetical protein